MPQALKIESHSKKLRANEKKWGATLVDAGWTMIPSTILAYQAALGLDPVDLNILLQIAQHWWRPDDPPFPKIRKIADAIGKSQSTVQRRITKMKKAGLIEVEHRFHDGGRGQTSSIYRFAGLKRKATEFAREVIKLREQTKLQKQALSSLNRLKAKGGLRVAAGSRRSDD